MCLKWPDLSEFGLKIYVLLRVSDICWSGLNLVCIKITVFLAKLLKQAPPKSVSAPNVLFP